MSLAPAPKKFPCLNCGKEVLRKQDIYLIICGTCARQLIDDWKKWGVMTKLPLGQKYPMTHHAPVAKFSRFFTLREPTRRKDPIVSWRCWNLSREGLLTSLVMNTEWPGPVFTVRLLKNGKPAGIHMMNKGKDATHDPGIYSYKSPELLFKLMNAPMQYSVFGRLENYGHVIEHEYGIRAQKVVIQELFVNPMAYYQPHDAVENLANTYACPVSYFQSTTNWYKEETEKWKSVIL